MPWLPHQLKKDYIHSPNLTESNSLLLLYYTRSESGFILLPTRFNDRDRPPQIDQSPVILVDQFDLRCVCSDRPPSCFSPNAPALSYRLQPFAPAGCIFFHSNMDLPASICNRASLPQLVGSSLLRLVHLTAPSKMINLLGVTPLAARSFPLPGRCPGQVRWSRHGTEPRPTAQIPDWAKCFQMALKPNLNTGPMCHQPRGHTLIPNSPLIPHS